MSYYTIKIVHLATIAFNIGFFSLRFYWMLKKPRWVQLSWVRGLSQLNDTILLAAGISLAVMSHQYPFTHHWLTAKLLALVVYIIAGSLALKWAKTKSARVFFGIVAFVTIGYILSVALTRTPSSWVYLEF